MTHLKFLVTFITLLLLAACSSGDSNSYQQEMERFRTKDGKVKVLSTIAMIGDLVRQIGGDYVDSLTLMRGDLDPHSYQLVKGDDEKLAYADIIFYNGLGLEHGPSLQHYLENNKKAVAVGNEIMKQDPSLILHIQNSLDPHIWMDISLWSKIIPLIVKELSEKDPAHADAFQHQAEVLTQHLLQEHEEIKREMASIPPEERYLVTSHDAFNYFTRVYLATDEERMNGTWSERFAAPEGLAPESQLSATHIREIIDYLAKHHVHVIFSESNISKDSIRKILSAGQEKGLHIVMAPCCLYADAMGEPGSQGDTYQKMIRHNADSIKEGWEKNR